ncbi:MAG: rRNA maturation RNase YbeY [Proteobacteria bacterium]|nr:rRNA maturation RNase YbeY [Pseudomonadota bacterium]
MNARVAVQYGTRHPWAPGVPSLRRWAEAALRGGPRGAELGIRVVGAGEGRRLNREFRGKDHPTNVLSFAAAAPAGPRSFLGDIAICAPVVAREARAQGKPLRAHWAHMVVHGVLHLLGHDHHARREAREMEAREVVILSGLGFGDPYQVD